MIEDPDVLRRVEDQKEGEHYYRALTAPADSCPECGSEEISDRQGHVRPDGDDRPPWLLVCENCGHEWETD